MNLFNIIMIIVVLAIAGFLIVRKLKKKQDEKIAQNEVNSQKENKMNIETIESDGEIFGEE